MSALTKTQVPGNSATGEAARLRAGEVSALELANTSIDRAAEVEPRINAISWERFEEARAEAAAIDRGELPPGVSADAPFLGVPILLKDHRCSAAGQENRTGTVALTAERRTWNVDSHVYRSLRRLGFVVLGRTTSPEFATAFVTESVASGVTRNPISLGHTSGGSSGGSASAVAAGVVSVAHATDGGGSIRVPASTCGLVGLKPSRGRLSVGPTAAESWGGATVEGVLVRTAQDAAAVTSGMARPFSGDPYVAPGRLPAACPRLDQLLSIGVMDRAPGGDAFASTEVSSVLNAVAGVLADHGHRVEPVHPEALDEDYQSRFEIMMAADVELLARSVEEVAGRPFAVGELAPRNERIRELAGRMAAVDYLEARHWLEAWGYRFAQWWEGGADVLVLPTLGGLPAAAGVDPRNDADIMDRVRLMQPMTSFANVAGLPAVSLPLGASAEGLPIGIQFVAPLGREDVLLALAAFFEESGPWFGPAQLGLEI